MSLLSGDTYEYSAFCLLEVCRTWLAARYQIRAHRREFKLLEDTYRLLQQFILRHKKMTLGLHGTRYYSGVLGDYVLVRVRGPWMATCGHADPHLEAAWSHSQVFRQSMELILSLFPPTTIPHHHNKPKLN